MSTLSLAEIVDLLMRDPRIGGLRGLENASGVSRTAIALIRDGETEAPGDATCKKLAQVLQDLKKGEVKTKVRGFAQVKKVEPRPLIDPKSGQPILFDWLELKRINDEAKKQEQEGTHEEEIEEVNLLEIVEKQQQQIDQLLSALKHRSA